MIFGRKFNMPCSPWVMLHLKLSLSPVDKSRGKRRDTAQKGKQEIKWENIRKETECGEKDEKKEKEVFLEGSSAQECYHDIGGAQPVSGYRSPIRC